MQRDALFHRICKVFITINRKEILGDPFHKVIHNFKISHKIKKPISKATPIFMTLTLQLQPFLQ